MQVRRVVLLQRVGAASAFALGALSYIGFAVRIYPQRGLWFDEYSTLYFADPQASIARPFTDSNTPLYYLVVRLVSVLGVAPQAALFVANQIALLVFSAAALWFLARIRRPLFGLIALGALLASPASLTMALEGRVYFTAQLACFALTAGVLARVEADDGRDSRALAALGVVAAAAHLFAALYVACLGGALALLALRGRRVDEVRFALILCAAAVAVVALWIAFCWRSLFGSSSVVNWIPFTWTYVKGQFWYLNKMLSGYGAGIVLMILGLVLGATIPTARRYVFLCVLSAAAFLLTPTLASLAKPMLAGRYLSICVPAIVLVLGFAGLKAAETGSRLGLACGGAIALFVALACVAAPAVAARFTRETRWPYHSAAVAQALKSCVLPRVRVYVPPGAPAPLYLFTYAHALARKDVTLVPSSQESEDVARYSCRLVAWGEQDQGLSHADDATVLRALGLTNSARAQLLIVRDNSLGFQVLRARS